MRKTLVLVSALALLGCTNRNFNTPQLLNIPRVLAVQAEPPQPKVGEATMLRALVYLPPSDAGAAGLIYHWKWCPLPTSPNNDYACPIDQAALDDLSASFGLGAAPSLDLGVGETATLVNPFPAQILAALCSGAINPFGAAGAGAQAGSADGGGKSLFSCRAGVGFPATVQLYVENLPGGNFTTGHPDAVFTVYLPTDDSLPGNLNPIVGGIQATWKGAPDGGGGGGGPKMAEDAGTQPYDATTAGVDAGEPAVDAGEVSDGGGAAQAVDAAGAPPIPWVAGDGVLLDGVATTVVPRDRRLELHAQIPDTASEDMAAAQIAAIAASQAAVDPKPKSSEQLTLKWYTEAGDFGDDGDGGYTTVFAGGYPDGTKPGFDEAIDNKWTPPKLEDYKGDTARLILVVRDNRGGVAWTFASATLENTP